MYEVLRIDSFCCSTNVHGKYALCRMTGKMTVNSIATALNGFIDYVNGGGVLAIEFSTSDAFIVIQAMSYVFGTNWKQLYTDNNEVNVIVEIIQ